MGIEAFCPNGHRINVKQSLAGRKGLCPTCGAKFRIPAAEGGAASTVPDLPTARLLDVAPDVVATLPRALPCAAAEAVAPPAAQQPKLHPVVAERPELRWCIAFPGGEPTEPLAAESMQAWLESGKAEGTEVVWRSDWPGWRTARDVFPDVIS